MCFSNLGWSAHFFQPPQFSPKLSFPAWLLMVSYSSYELSNMLWLFFSLTGWLENPQRSKMAAETLPLKILTRVRACHYQCAARWTFMAYPYFTNTVVNKISSQVQRLAELLLKHTFPKLFESLIQVPLRRIQRRKLIIASLLCTTYTMQFCWLLSPREKRGCVWENIS